LRENEINAMKQTIAEKDRALAVMQKENAELRQRLCLNSQNSNIEIVS